jgi:hypothetical protein
VQCSGPIPDSAWTLLNEAFFAIRPEVELRICSGDVESFDFLERISPSVSSLTLGPTRSKKPSLRILSRFRKLKILSIDGHSNGIEAVSDLSLLEQLVLHSVTTPDLEYLAPLQNLWSLDIALGAIKSLDGINGKPSLKHLRLSQIREFEGTDALPSLRALQNLSVGGLARLRSVPSLAGCSALRRAVLQNMKSLGDFTAFREASALEEFLLLDGMHQSPEQLVPVLENPNVQRVSAFFGSHQKNRQFTTLRAEYGKASMDPSAPFDYL